MVVQYELETRGETGGTTVYFACHLYAKFRVDVVVARPWKLIGIALFAFVHRPSFKIIPAEHAGILGETQFEVIVDSNVVHLLFVRPRHSSSDEC